MAVIPGIKLVVVGCSGCGAVPIARGWKAGGCKAVYIVGYIAGCKAGYKTGVGCGGIGVACRWD